MYNNYANVYHYIIVFIGFGFGGKWWLVDFQNALAKSSHSAEVKSLQFSCRVVFFSDVFAAGRQNCLVAWTSPMPLDRSVSQLKKRLEKKIHE